MAQPLPSLISLFRERLIMLTNMLFLYICGRLCARAGTHGAATHACRRYYCFELLGPVVHYVNGRRAGPLQWQVEQKPLAVRGDVVEVPGVGIGRVWNNMCAGSN